MDKQQQAAVLLRHLPLPGGLEGAEAPRLPLPQRPQLPPPPHVILAILQQATPAWREGGARKNDNNHKDKESGTAQIASVLHLAVTAAQRFSSLAARRKAALLAALRAATRGRVARCHASRHLLAVRSCCKGMC